METKYTYSMSDLEEYTPEQIKEICLGFMNGVNLLDFVKSCTVRKLDAIRVGLQFKADISKFLDPAYDAEQSLQILVGLISGIDVDQYCNPEYDWEKMQEIRLELSMAKQK